jgi:NADH-ubiquinone oxidoreductase chain 5
MRKMGGLKNLLPFSYSIMLIGSLALMGFPFLTGFYSKDTILEVAYAKYTIWGHFSYYLGTLAAFCTAFYSMRLLFLVFLAEPNGNLVVITNAHDGSWRMGFPLFILSILSIVVGFMTRDFFIGFGTHFWGAAIFVLPQNYVLSDIEFIDLYHKLLPLIVSIIGALSAYFIYSFGMNYYYKIKTTRTFKIIYNYLNRKWYFDRVYNEFVGQNVLNISYSYTYKDIDRGLIEKVGPSGIVDTVGYIFSSLNGMQSGYMFHYLFMFLVAIVVLILVFVIFSSFSVSLIGAFFLCGYALFEDK